MTDEHTYVASKIFTHLTFSSVFQKFELLETVGEDFCGMDVNTPIGGNMPVQSVAVLTTNTLLTSVAATTTGDFTVVFAGTDTGHVKKVPSDDEEVCGKERYVVEGMWGTSWYRTVQRKGSEKDTTGSLRKSTHA